MLQKLLLRSTLALLLLSFFSFSPAAAVAGTEELSQADFQALSREISLMHKQNIFTGGSGKPVKFNVGLHTTGKQGFSSEGIALAQELADFTNEVVSTKGKVSLSLKGKPNLKKYFNAASAYSNKAALNTTNIVPESILSELTCGIYWRPVPASQPQFYTYPTAFSTKKAAEDTIKSWGYHVTAPAAGDGFTRPQTYKPYLCGLYTFRDHAYVALINKKWKIREQNYTGKIPGEPNPEVYLSGPWPYPTWPAYVYWWHRWGPGA